MELFLLAACLGLFGMAVTALAFAAATRSEEPPPAAPLQPEILKAASQGRFFADSLPQATAMRVQVPIEALLLQIESHVRLEQAAAESFLEYPTAALLHSRTTSPLVN
jgi:hypothetical protein